jgi:transposase-like protein
MAGLTQDQRESALARWRVLRAHLEDGRPLVRVAAEADVPERTLRRWLAAYQDGGLGALVPLAPASCEGRQKKACRPVKTLAADFLITARAVTAGGGRDDSKERAVADPVLIAVVISCAHAASRVLDALAQRIILRARQDLVQAAAALPPGTEVGEQGRAGTWEVRAGQAAGRDRR